MFLLTEPKQGSPDKTVIVALALAINTTNCRLIPLRAIEEREHSTGKTTEEGRREEACPSIQNLFSSRIYRSSLRRK
jgi:hypothetical protein